MEILTNLLKNLPDYEFLGDTHELKVTGITYDSRQIKPGNIFVCIHGFRLNGHDYIDDALENGASVIIVQEDCQLKPGVVYIKVQDSREALAKLSEAYYGFSQKRLNLIGVTGTNGKTTTAYMIESILRQANFTTGLVGTIRNKIGDHFLPTERTTPESSDLHELFHQMLEIGVTHTVMEVSSHALELKRVEDFQYKVGIFTNITQDHLDFHDSLENYKIAKGKLFKKLTPDGVGIINLDDPASEYMVSQCNGRVITYGIQKDADLRASEIEVAIDGVSYHVTTPVGETEIKLNFTGYFNIYNSLAAMGTGLAFDIPLEVIKTALQKLPGVTGRFEQVKCGQEFGVIVDYAHSPDGMENVLRTAKEIVHGRLIAVFGCGGDRDRTKRPIMGKIGAEYSDLCIITSDNPRTEDPVQILEDVEKGVLGSKNLQKYLIIPDRREAIFKAIQEAKSGDLVLIMGKGHETYQIFKDKVIDFDDREVAREAIKSL